MKNLINKNGITIKELKELLSTLRNNDVEQDFECWIDNGNGTSSIVTSIIRLNKQDILFSSETQIMLKQININKLKFKIKEKKTGKFLKETTGLGWTADSIVFHMAAFNAFSNKWAGKKIDDLFEFYIDDEILNT